MDPRRRAVRRYDDAFGTAPEMLVRAPGRVKVIGEHTNCDDGWVLPAATGAMMEACHARLRDDFEASSDALDAIVTAARALDGCHGARVIGGGFAGCAVALVAAPAVREFASALRERYRAATRQESAVRVCEATGGASALDPAKEAS